MPNTKKSQILITHLKLWLPDEESHWGRRLNPVIKIVGKAPISMPRGFSFAKWDGIRSLTTKEEMNQTVRWAAAFQPQQQQPNVFRTLTQTFNGPCAVRVFIKD